MYQYFFALLISLLLVPPVSFAQTSKCTIIYGGGEIDCEATVTATAKTTPTPTSRKPATQSGTTTTKGGLPVHEPTNATETPATGPETLALVTLLPAAAAGFYLRKKTS